VAVDLDTFRPYVTTARRHYFLRERELRRSGQDGAADYFRSAKLAQAGTALADDVPGRADLLAAGVLVTEEVTGAGVDELRGYGLSTRSAVALLTTLEG
jgi:hypothetical protein